MIPIALRSKLANRLPGLGPIDRRLRAFKDSRWATRSSYSQYGEDAFIFSELAKYDKTGGIYVDIGANHPTTLSNSYLLYRHGLHGVTIEPNRELCGLHKAVRPRDIALGVGCGEHAALAQFHLLSAPVLSSFSAQNVESSVAAGTKVWRTEYLPILPLDLILAEIKHSFLYLLSIDTEGLDLEVLRGATQTLKNTLLLCVEMMEETEAGILALLAQDFELLETFACNQIFVNRAMRPQKLRAS